MWILWWLMEGCAIAAVTAGMLSVRPGVVCIKSLELRGRGADQGLLSSPSPSLLWQAEGAGSENESVNLISKGILCAQQSSGLCNPSQQDFVEAKAPAMTKEGFPRPWDEQEHRVLKKDSLCVFGVSRDTAQEQSPSGAAREADPAAVLGPAGTPAKVPGWRGGCPVCAGGAGDGSPIEVVLDPDIHTCIMPGVRHARCRGAP